MRVQLQVSELKPEWLVEIAPHYYQLKDVEDRMLFLPPPIYIYKTFMKMSSRFVLTHLSIAAGTKKMPRGEGRAS